MAFIPSTAALAQTTERDPLNAPTVSPPISYQSAFSDYKPYQDPEWMPWKTANDVVREFGGMAAMGGMDDMKSTDSADVKTGGGEQDTQPAKPSHDMRNMKSETPASAPKKPASPGSSPTKMKTMPGHDMRKMQGSDKLKIGTSKATPAPGMKDKGGMTDMPGHDMGKMQKTPAVPATKTPPPSSKPATPAPMPDHSGMSK